MREDVNPEERRITQGRKERGTLERLLLERKAGGGGPGRRGETTGRLATNLVFRVPRNVLPFSRLPAFPYRVSGVGVLWLGYSLRGRQRCQGGKPPRTPTITRHIWGDLAGPASRASSLGETLKTPWRPWTGSGILGEVHF
ncbi:PREDICTED: uncharacterized protein LOC106752089 [Dinoponera quadriceps]|uniref:Uncharacterized protein LOC106752089 n=1 Tax=Dinoponera quadriceps TaxID=609295 RepID=A0A6P3YGT2_DINQU|nr:PREDICTED: uncharacterized protein LOC106752089 [Dinoponera quadriceps]